MRLRQVPSAIALLLLLLACENGVPASAPAEREPSAAPATSSEPSSPGLAESMFPRSIDLADTSVNVTRAATKDGPPPRVPYVDVIGEGQVVVLPGGAIVATLEESPMGNEGYRHLSFAPHAGGWLTAFDFMGLVATLLAPDGTQLDHIGSGPWEMFSTPDRQRVVFSFQGRMGATRIGVLGPDGLQRLGKARSTAGFLDERSIVVSTKDGVFRVDTSDGSRTLVPNVVSASATSMRADLIIGDAEGAEGTPAHGVFDARTGEPTLGSPDFQLLGFSPSGRLVVGNREVGDGGGYWDRSLTVVAEASTGRVVAAFRRKSSDPEALPVWEGNDALLFEGRRFYLDGRVDRPRLLVNAAQSCCVLMPAPTS